MLVDISVANDRSKSDEEIVIDDDSLIESHYYHQLLEYLLRRNNATIAILTHFNNIHICIISNKYASI